MLLLSFILSLLAGYLLGSIPTGFLVARARGIDIRTVGSGNIGATNALRILGKGPGSLVLLIDAAKGYLACMGIPWLLSQWGFLSPILTGGTHEWLKIAAGFSAVLGHNYTCWLEFKGGKGIATSAGVLLGWVPAALGIIFLVFVAVFAVSRYVSLASIAAALALPFATWLTGGSGSLVAITTLLSTLAIFKHRSNIQRLLAGTETRIGGKKPMVGGHTP